ncbi:hypothetical protein CK203_052418 [Vitis vinifera]|uniref:Chromo domain-containing protein n=1 Tax=Vitis vinifera TaxID=29760 RepID=A0A438H6Z8_VITVI|nr:hypothetical protein CK203_052418 [Vitis vinifera]
MKKWTDKKRCHTEYKVEDMVLAKLLPQQFKSVRPMHKGLVRRYEGPFPILGKVGKAPTTVVTSYDKEVEHIITDRVIKRGVSPTTEFLVKWKGLTESEASWEPVDALWQFQEQIEQFRAEGATRTSAA